jgi:hypothetical protein
VKSKNNIFSLRGTVKYINMSFTITNTEVIKYNRMRSLDTFYLIFFIEFVRNVNSISISYPHLFVFLFMFLSFSPLSRSLLSVVCFDAKISFDDNAEFRQKAIFALGDMSESDPTETEAAKWDLKYIGLDGNIACFGEFWFMAVHCLHTYMFYAFSHG